jgi:hypothetical protein
METFVVRIWTPSPELAREASAAVLRGTVEHVGTKAQTQFRTGSDLLEILTASLEAHLTAASHGIKQT